MIFFLDIDGVFIPGRSYMMATQTKPIVTTFDPCVVGMINDLAEQYDADFVIHSSWLRTNFGLHTAGCDTVKHHMINQGLNPDRFHEDDSCQYRFSGDRWTAIGDWLDNHPEVGPEDYWIFEDEIMYHDSHRINKDRIINTDFDEGLTMHQYRKLCLKA